MSKRAKQINITIPMDSVSVLDDFDQMCAAHGIKRSAQLLTLMQHWLDTLEGSDLDDPCQQQDALWPSADVDRQEKQDELPEWMK